MRLEKVMLFSVKTLRVQDLSRMCNKLTHKYNQCMPQVCLLPEDGRGDKKERGRGVEEWIQETGDRRLDSGVQERRESGSGWVGEGRRESGIEMSHRHHDHFVRLRNDLKGNTSLMSHQGQYVMDDYA